MDNSDPNWIETDPAAALTHGQKVKLEHNDGSTLYGQVQDGTQTQAIVTGPTTRVVLFWVNNGWTLFVEAPPKPILPTEPGIYVDKDGDPWILKPEDDRYEQRWFLEGVCRMLTEASKYAPFTRLETPADAAKKVLARVHTIHFENNQFLGATLKQVAAEFEVTF